MQAVQAITAHDALLAGADLATSEIAELLGISRQSVVQHMRRHKATPIKGSAIGRHGNSLCWSCEDYERAYPRLASIRSAGAA